MPILSKPSGAARMAIIYITVGALIDVWSGIWLLYLLKNNPAREGTWFWCYGFLLTGVVLMIIGFTIGRIGRSARHAEMPPEEGAEPAVVPPAGQENPGGNGATATPAVTPPPTAQPASAAPTAPAAPSARVRENV